MEKYNEPKVQQVVVPAEAPKVNTGLVVTTIVYLIAIFNAGAAMFGFDINIQADHDFIYEGVSAIFGLGAFLAAYWKNHNISKAARIKAAAADQIHVKK